MTFEESTLRTSALCTSGSGTFTDDLLGRKRFPRHFPGPFCFSLYPTGTEIPLRSGATARAEMGQSNLAVYRLMLTVQWLEPRMVAAKIQGPLVVAASKH